MRNNDKLEILAIGFLGIVFAIIGISSIIDCFQNYKTVTIDNWMFSIILTIAGIAFIILTTVWLKGDDEK